MVSITKKKFFISDWLYRTEIIEAATINQAVSEFLGTPIALANDKNLSDAFACELTDELNKELQSKEPGEEQSTALVDFLEVKYFIKVTH